jgi:glycosyltransferase involved in cell wall biosynthesis
MPRDGANPAQASRVPTIVHVMGWVSQQYGSFERFLERLAARGAAAGLETHLVFPSRPRSEAFVRNVRAEIHEVPLARHPLDRRAWRGLRDVFARTRATHVHAHFGLDAMIAMRVAQSLGIARRFLSKHIIPSSSFLSGIRHRWLARQAEVFFAVSDRVANALIELGVPKEKVVRVYLGVDTDAYRPGTQKNRTEKIVLCASHLRPGKGVELLAPLAAALARDPGKVRVLCAGDGPLRAALARAAADAPLEVLGLRQDIPELLASADLFVFPTTGDEGLGLGPIEAMAAGLPIVASAVSDLPSIAGDAMRFVPPGDLDALIAACRALLTNDEEAHALGARARAAAEERFSVAGAVDAHLARYLP